VQWNRKGYCRVAYLSNLSNNGSVLISEGTDLSSAEAGEAFVTSNQWIARLRNRLSLKRGEKIPHFEVLLAADLAVDSAPRFEIVSVRTTDTK
jgi:surface antigen